VNVLFLHACSKPAAKPASLSLHSIVHKQKCCCTRYAALATRSGYVKEVWQECITLCPSMLFLIMLTAHPKMPGEGSGEPLHRMLKAATKALQDMMGPTCNATATPFAPLLEVSVPETPRHGNPRYVPYKGNRSLIVGWDGGGLHCNLARV